MRGTCTIDGCTKPLHGRGLCGMHYGQLRKAGGVPVPERDAKVRFFQYVNQTPTCWEWVGALSHSGYGNYLNKGAHRFAYSTFVGPIPTGLLVLHRCDNRGCVNPAHLFIGTQQDNLLDAKAKGRTATGDRHGSRLHPERMRRGLNHPRGNASLSIEQVNAIRTAVGTQRAIAQRFGISQSQVGRIRKGQRWQGVA